MAESDETAPVLVATRNGLSVDDTSKKRKNGNRSGSCASKQRLQGRLNSGVGDDKSGDERRGKGGSVLWTILLVGLLFSMVDVFYMVYLMDGNEIQNSMHFTPEDSPIAGPDNEELRDKRQIFDLLRRAGIDPSKLDAGTVRALPSWEEVVKLYGPKPIILGLDRCRSFQEDTQKLGFVGAAGTFNSGTNLMAELLIANCHMQTRMEKFGARNRGIRWQVPWGKHTPPGDDRFRKNHKTYLDTYIDADAVLPAVTIRDPPKWHQPDPTRCPDFSLSDLTTTVKYAEFRREHESILHLWNDYYREYLEVPFPRLIVRIEDLIFHPEEVTTSVCNCAGGSMSEDGKFKYIVNSAKKGAEAHGTERTGYIEAIIKYGSHKRRYETYKFSSDLEYIRDHLDLELMSLLRYSPPDPERAADITY